MTEDPGMNWAICGTAGVVAFIMLFAKEPDMRHCAAVEFILFLWAAAKFYFNLFVTKPVGWIIRAAAARHRGEG